MRGQIIDCPQIIVKGDVHMSEFKTIKYKDNELELDLIVSPDNSSLLFSKDDLSKLFKRDRSGISKYLKKIFTTNELDEKSNVQKLHITNSAKPVTYYKLEVVQTLSRHLKSNLGVTLNKFWLDNSNGRLKNVEIIIYNNGNVNLAVNVSPQEDTVWLNVSQIASLFDSTVQNIYMHIGKIVEEGELEVNSVCKDFLQTPFFLKQIPTVGPDGKTYILDYYNLDMILSVGYRVKSKNAILFRRWANSVLKQYLLKGYVVDDNRVTVSKENFIELEHDVQRIKQEIIDIKEKVLIEPVKEKLFYAGQFFDAYEFICSLLGKAKKSIDIIDPYFDVDSLIYFQKTNRGIKKTILTSKKTKLSKLDVDIFERQYGHLVIKKNKRIHDRFIILDETICYSIGTSINSHTGGKLFMVSMIEDEDIIKMLLKKLER